MVYARISNMNVIYAITICNEDASIENTLGSQIYSYLHQNCEVLPTLTNLNSL